MNDAPQPQTPLQTPPSSRPAIRVLLAVLLAFSLTGYFVGLRQSRQASQRELVYGRESVSAAEQDDVPAAVGYAEQPRRKLGPNKDWRNNLTSLRQPATSLPPKTPGTADEIAEALARREARRAFDGAPPITPHPTPPLGVAACLACHEQGALIGDKRAARMSHPLYANCTQCHVEVTQPDTKQFWENTFQALRPKPAERAFPGAPPALPHPAWMRNDCQSCHGPAGPAPLRTTHPERLNCVQCHALSSPQDLLPKTTAENRRPEPLPTQE
jgi:cytochrome c-type protein NapB